MDQPVFWILAAVLAVFVVGPLAFGLRESHLRRRDRALGTRRKTKLRL